MLLSCIFLGIVPQFCEEIFQGIDKEKEAGTKAEYEVRFGYPFTLY